MNGVFAFIESNTTGTGNILLQKAIERGYKVLFFTSNPDLYSFLAQLPVQIVQIDTQKKDLLISYLKSIRDLRGVFSTSEYFIEIAADTARGLGLNCNSMEAIALCRNKWALFEKLKEINIPLPKTYLIKNQEEIKPVTEHTGFPIIIKPIMGTGSIGVKLCYNLQEAIEHGKLLLAQQKNERGFRNLSGFLIQEYILGNEYSVEIFGLGESYHFIGVTGKYTSPLPYFVETGHDFPANIGPKIENEITTSLTHILSFIGLKFGPFHVELKLYKKQIFIIEINPRLAGGMIPLLIEYAKGIDVLNHIISQFANQPFEILPIRNHYASIRFFIPPVSGIIEEISSVKEIQKLKGVKTVSLFKGIGDKIELKRDYRDRIGHVITYGRTYKESRDLADTALKQFKIKMLKI